VSQRSRLFGRVSGLALGVCLWAAGAHAEDHAGEAHEAGEHAGSEHAGSEHAGSEHGAHHGEHAAPTFADINWFQGFLGESEDAEPGLLWRAPGTPVPLGALLLNTAILFYFLGRFGGPAISSGLLARKQRIAGDIEAARRMQDEAKKQLDYYEQKLAHMAAETERILAEVRVQAKAEHERIVAEAKAKHLALEEEARQIVEHERAHARQAAIQTMVARAIDGARDEITKHFRPDDQERLAKALEEQVAGQLGASVLGPTGSGSGVAAGVRS